MIVDSQGFIIDLNHTVAKILLCNKEEVVNQKLTEVFTDNGNWVNLILNSLITGREYYQQYKLCKVGDEVKIIVLNIYFESGGEKFDPFNVIVFIQEKEKSFYRDWLALEREELLVKPESLFDNLFDAVIIINKEGYIVDANCQVERILNVSKTDLLGKYYSYLLNFALEYEPEGSVLKKALKWGEIFQHHIIKIADMKGQEKLLKSNIFPQIDPYGNILGVICIGQDITPEKSNEEEYNIEDRLRLAEKLAVVGEMATGTAHEIKNPLGAIKGFLEVLEREELDQQTRKNYLAIVKQELLQLEEMVREFLNLAKSSDISQRLETVLLCHVIKDLLYFYKYQIHKYDVQFIFTCTQCAVFLQLDQNKLKQVLINLIKNALESMSTTQLEGNQGHKLSIKLELIEGDKYIRMGIIDTGAGISNELLSKLFSPFSTTKTNGTGLGLPVSKKIIENFGGKIWAKNNGNTLNRGANFFVELPIKEVKFDNNELPCSDKAIIPCERIITDDT